MFIVVLIVILGLGSAYFFGDDNPVEETTEKLIKNKIQKHQNSDQHR